MRSSVFVGNLNTQHYAFSIDLPSGAILANSRLPGFITFLLLGFSTFCLAGDLLAQEKRSPANMPLPAHVIEGEGEFLIGGDFGIALKGYKEARLERAQERFLHTLSQETGIPLWRQATSTRRAS